MTPDGHELAFYVETETDGVRDDALRQFGCPHYRPVALRALRSNMSARAAAGSPDHRFRTLPDARPSHSPDPRPAVARHRRLPNHRSPPALIELRPQSSTDSQPSPHRDASTGHIAIAAAHPRWCALGSGSGLSTGPIASGLTYGVRSPPAGRNADNSLDQLTSDGKGAVTECRLAVRIGCG